MKELDAKSFTVLERKLENSQDNLLAGTAIGHYTNISVFNGPATINGQVKSFTVESVINYLKFMFSSNTTMAKKIGVLAKNSSGYFLLVNDTEEAKAFLKYLDVLKISSQKMSIYFHEHFKTALESSEFTTWLLNEKNIDHRFLNLGYYSDIFKQGKIDELTEKEMLKPSKFNALVLKYKLSIGRTCDIELLEI